MSQWGLPPTVFHTRALKQSSSKETARPGFLLCTAFHTKAASFWCLQAEFAAIAAPLVQHYEAHAGMLVAENSRLHLQVDKLQGQLVSPFPRPPTSHLRRLTCLGKDNSWYPPPACLIRSSGCWGHMA